MDGKERMKELYKYFAEKKKVNEEMYSIANIFYEMGNREEGTKDELNVMIENKKILPHIGN